MSGHIKKSLDTCHRKVGHCVLVAGFLLITNSAVEPWVEYSIQFSIQYFISDVDNPYKYIALGLCNSCCYYNYNYSTTTVLANPHQCVTWHIAGPIYMRKHGCLNGVVSSSVTIFWSGTLCLSW